MRPSHPGPPNERGGALIVAVLVLIALAAIAMTMISSIVTDRRLANFDMQATRALNNAEAGVSEALERIRRRDVPNNDDPKMVAQVFLVSKGDVPVKGADTTALATGQPVGQWTRYSTESPGPDVLTIQYKTTPDHTQIYRYDPTATPMVNTASGAPIFVITSVGRSGSARRRIVTEVTSPLIDVSVRGAAVSTGMQVHFQNNAFGNGHDHRSDTPTGTGGGFVRTPAWETGDAMAGGYSAASVLANGGARVIGSPNSLESQMPYHGPWEVLGMTQAEFLQWIGPPQPISALRNPSGLTYVVTPNATTGEGNGKATGGAHSLTGNITGEGLLYVNGSLDVSGDFTFRGLIYVEGDLHVTGSGWILGSIVARHVVIQGGGSKPFVVLASKSAISDHVSKYGGVFKTLSWREVDPTPGGTPPIVASPLVVLPPALLPAGIQ